MDNKLACLDEPWIRLMTSSVHGISPCPYLIASSSSYSAGHICFISKAFIKPEYNALNKKSELFYEADKRIIQKSWLQIDDH